MFGIVSVTAVINLEVPSLQFIAGHRHKGSEWYRSDSWHR